MLGRDEPVTDAGPADSVVRRIPRLLYKYLGLGEDGFARLSFLENELVRFTQPSELNDPADCAPRFYADRFSPQDYEEARREAARTTFIDFGGEPTLKDLEDFFLTMLPRGRVGDIDGMFPRVIPALRREPFSRWPNMTTSRLVAGTSDSAQRWTGASASSALPLTP